MMQMKEMWSFKIQEVVLDEHCIYGTWDDCQGTQFLVYWHPNGKHAHVFMLAGANYGGGITNQRVCLNEDVLRILNTANNEHEAYDRMNDLVHHIKEDTE